MRVLHPPPLRPGDRIGVAAPGSAVDPAALEAGLACLAARGYVPVAGAHVGARHGYLAGTDAQRLDDLNRLLADPELAAIWFARGGYGSARLVADLDLAPLRSRPKSLIGYSDLTVVQAAAWRRLRLASYHGPMVAELADPASFDAPSLWAALEGGGTPIEHRLPGAAVVRAGTGAGPLLGGCLSLLVSLVGTPFEVETDGAILFWEEVNEEPFRIDRMLGQLRLAGRLRGLQGMIVARLVGCRPKDPRNDLPLEEILETHLRGTDYPVVVDFPAGHAPGKLTLPLGRTARLDTRAATVTIDPA